MTEAEQFEGLEATAANLRRVLGDEGMRALAAAHGGRRLYVPRSPGAHHPITAALGRAGADRLAAAFHGMTVDVPIQKRVKAEIRRLAGEGLTRAAIARQMHVTERWVYKTLAEPESPPSRQASFFD